MTSERSKRRDFLSLIFIAIFKEYPEKSQLWKSETCPNQGTWLGIPWLGLVSLCQIWGFWGYSFNTLKYSKMGICYFFLCNSATQVVQAGTLQCSDVTPTVTLHVTQNVTFTYSVNG